MGEASSNRRSHWENVYETKGDLDLSWFQKEPEISLRLVRRFSTPEDAVIDVGAGASPLAALLSSAGYSRVAALDVSHAAIERSRQRAGATSAAIDWIVRDVLDAGDLRGFRLWHDRAVFHFLTDEADRARYAEVAAGAIDPGGHAVIAAFALDGPQQCSGLPVQRYDASGLEKELAPRFELVHEEREAHLTPWGKEQPFTVAVLRRSQMP